MNGYSNFPERIWWLVLVRGLAAVIFGIAAFAWPGLTAAVLVFIFGVYVLLDGVVSIVDSIRARSRVSRWWWWLLDGVLGVIFGAATLLMPGVTAFVLLMFIAAWAILGGVVRVYGAIRLRKKIEGAGLLGAGGVLSILFGLVLVVIPGTGILSLVWLMGIWAVVFGALFIMLAFRLRKAGKALRTPLD